MRILKIQLPDYPAEVIIEVKEGVQILSVGLDPKEDMCMWALMDESKPMSTIEIGIYWTGQEPAPGRKFLGTVRRAEFMYHIFQL